MVFYPAVDATKQEPTYPDFGLSTELPPRVGPFPYSSSQDPSLVLPLFYLEVSPEDWDRYDRWWRSAVSLDGSKVLVRFDTNRVLIEDALSLKPGTWLTDNILHYFTHSVKRIFKIKSSVLVFFSSYFLTLLFNEGHANSGLVNKFCYKNVATWWSKKRTRLKTSLQEVRTLVFFQNQGRQHWVTYIIFQDLKIIEVFDSMGSSDANILKGLYRWLFIEYQRIGIHLDSTKWRLYRTRRSTPRQRNGYDCGIFSILFALHAGLRLNLNNISQEHVPRVRCQMLLHLLQMSRADENDDEILVLDQPGRQENAQIALNLADDSDYDNEAPAYENEDAVLVVDQQGRQENAHIPVNLADDLLDDDGEASADIDGIRL